MKKVTQLVEDTAPLGADLLLTVDDPNGSPASKKATIANVAKATEAKGEIYIYEGVTTQTGITTTPVKFALFNTPQGFNGRNLNTTPDKINNDIAVTNAGEYAAFLSLSATGTANTKFTAEIYVNGVGQKRASGRSTGSATDVMSLSVGATLQLAAGDVVEIYVNSDKAGGADLTAEYAQFIAVR